MSVSHAITTATETPTTTGDLSGKFEKFLCICLTTMLFLLEIIICSFNNNVFKKCPNVKAFFFQFSAQFFTALI